MISFWAQTLALFSFDLPVRDPDKSYLAAVDDWHDAIALVWADTIQNASAKLDQPVQTVALLIWGDPSLYDSSMRIAARLDPEPTITVAPGITSVQALTAAHNIPVNALGAPFLVTTGRRLRDEGFPNDADTAIIMLDGNCSFTSLNGAEFDIWWGLIWACRNRFLFLAVLMRLAKISFPAAPPPAMIMAGSWIPIY